MGLNKVTTYLGFHNIEEQEQRWLQTQQPSVKLFSLPGGPKSYRNVFYLLYRTDHFGQQNIKLFKNASLEKDIL